MDGVPSHFETFDPKPDSPAEIRGEFSAISTNVPGIRFSQHMTELAAMADKHAIVRSVCHNQGNHGAGNHYMMTGAPPRIPVGCGAFVSFHPSMGSVAAYERQAPHGLPGYFSIPSMTRSDGPHFLGAKYAPFVVGGEDYAHRLMLSSTSSGDEAMADAGTTPAILITGRIEARGEVDAYVATFKKDEAWRLRVQIRTLGQELDPVLTISDVSGKELQGTGDSAKSVKLKREAKEAWNGPIRIESDPAAHRVRTQTTELEQIWITIDPA